MDNVVDSPDSSAVGGTPALPEAAASPGEPGCMSSLGWFAAAPVLACFSPTFYANAARRRTGSAILFFFLFAFVITGLQSCGILWGMVKVGQDIRQAFDSGEFPVLTITNGVAEVDGTQPYVIADNDTFFAIDTTGQYTDIDRRRYAQGLLIKRTSVVILNRQGDYQEAPLSAVQEMLGLGDPFVLDAETATNYWTGFALIVSVVVFLFLAIWNTLVRLAYVALIALAVWGLTALIRPGTGFGPVLATGLYALSPALFVVFLISQTPVGFPGLTTLFLLIFWGLGLAAAFQTRRTEPAASPSIGAFLSAERPLRAWRALIAIPLALDVVLETIFGWDAFYVTWPLALLTVGALAVASFWPLFMTPNAAAQAK